jgi:hypothetical protein
LCSVYNGCDVEAAYTAEECNLREYECLFTPEVAKCFAVFNL